MALAIRFENVSKQYRLGEIGTGTLSQDLERTVARWLGRPDPFATIGRINDREQAGGDFVWALKEVSFEVPSGEVMGIIGRNGAGKSTLLKLLSRITAPTGGTIKANGRIASLLEVGTGFHPELTGRENIYLNGAILGMTSREVSSRFEQIAEFSGCSKYIDTPVKRYSSGMLVRLGFSVAAHLDCEVLVVDEVLAVGDAEFQKRCLGRMQEVASQQGRTVLFVSHNMVSIGRLCTSCVLLDRGSLAAGGSVDSVVRAYEQLIQRNSATTLAERDDRNGNGRAKAHCIGFVNRQSDETNDQNIRSGSDLGITVEFYLDAPSSVDVHLGIRDIYGGNVGHLAVTTATGKELQCDRPGEHRVVFEVPNLPLAEGVYSFTVFITTNGDIADWVQEAATLNVASGDFFGTGKLPPSDQSRVLIAHRIAAHS